MPQANGNGDGAGDGNGSNANGAGAGDSSKQNQNQNGGDGAGGNSNANNQNNGGGSQDWDPEKSLTKEQWQAIYGSGRFKQLNERAQKAAELEKAQKDVEDAKLKEQGKWEELAKSKDTELSQMQIAVVSAEIKAEAARLGAVNPAIVAQAIDRASVKFGKDGAITGVTEAVEALKASDPYLFGNSNSNNQSRRMGSPTNPGNQNTGYKFKMSEVRDQKFYKEHRAEILQAMRTGQIDKEN